MCQICNKRPCLASPKLCQTFVEIDNNLNSSRTHCYFSLDDLKLRCMDCVCYQGFIRLSLSQSEKTDIFALASKHSLVDTNQLPRPGPNFSNQNGAGCDAIPRLTAIPAIKDKRDGCHKLRSHRTFMIRNSDPFTH